MFGKTLVSAGMQVTAFDRLQTEVDTSIHQVEKTRELNIKPADDIVSAVEGADLVISTVTASEATAAVKEASPGLQPNTTWLDLNSVSPSTKKEIGDVVSVTGAEFVEGVAMDTVPSCGAKVPLLLCGNSADKLSLLLNNTGLNTRSLGKELGKASTTKMLRSVLIKGMEALFAEAVEAAGQSGVTDEVMDSLAATYPGLDWRAAAGYQLSRASLHASRRAAEMRESAALVEQLGFDPIMASAIALKQQQLADRDVGSHYPEYDSPSVEDFLDAVGSN